ncbi:expressed unknown protein [Seminavis robusta]|uniref:Uncharacterized protein n=1 Tax=Seminavis robusta TaxID=568900 RepID=A0A9N8HF89_9STRA|nr:expressed unknown protein [Seminavis robusta]|eukprot:Sro337_g120740.1 n/a (101) ;mRNA; f:69841-70143
MEHGDIRVDIELLTATIFHFGCVLVSRAFREALGVGFTRTRCVGYHVGEKRAYQRAPPFEDGFLVFLRGNAFVWDVFGFHRVDTNLLAIIFQEEIEMGEA